MKRYLPGFLIVTLALAGCDSQQQRETRYLARGQKYFDQGQFEKARLEYRNAARIAPIDPVPAYRLGLADEALSNIGGAYGDFMHADELDKTYLPALFKLANYDLAGGQVDEAQHYIDAALALSADDPEARALNGAVLLRGHDYPGATGEAGFALSKDATNITAYSVLTGVALATNDPAKAAGIVAEGVSKNPGDLSLLLLQAKVAQTDSDYETVDAAYQRLFVLRPDFIQLRLDLANIYTAANMLDDAERTLRDAVAAQADDMGLKQALVSFLGDHRSVEIAEREIRADMQAEPENKDFSFWLADLYATHGNPDKAILILKNLIAENPLNETGLNARVALAHVYFVRGDKDLAQPLIDEALAGQPDNRDALFMQAALAYDRGDYQNAASSLRTILQTYNDDADAKKLLAETFVRQGYLNLAVETLTQLAESDPNDRQIRARLAQLTTIQKKDPDGLMMRADFANALGHYEEATKLYEAILAANPGMAIAANNLAAMIAEYRYNDPAELDKAYRLAHDFGNTKRPELLDTLAWIYYRQNNIDSALALMQRISTLSPEMHYHYGAILAKAGKKEEARPHLQQAVAGNAKYPGSEEAKTLLDKL